MLCPLFCQAFEPNTQLVRTEDFVKPIFPDDGYFDFNVPFHNKVYSSSTFARSIVFTSLPLYSTIALFLAAKYKQNNNADNQNGCGYINVGFK